jgi:lantibiotic modifying enzyme
MEWSVSMFISEVHISSVAKELKKNARNESYSNIKHPIKQVSEQVALYNSYNIMALYSSDSTPNLALQTEKINISLSMQISKAQR